MSLILESAVTDSIGLPAFLDHCEHDLGVRDTESLAEAAPAFKRLLNNRRLLRDYIESELLHWRNGGSDHEYIGHTIVLARREHFFVRANIWIAPDPSRPLPSRNDASFGYLYPHDHNFAFLTGGYFGPGYQTVLFDYDEERVTGLPGEHVDIHPRGRAALPLGTMMLYEPSRDIHYQEHPAQLSISLNVVVPGTYKNRAQYLFDVERQRIDVALTPSTARGTTLCALAAEIGDDSTHELLADVVASEVDPRIRVAAAEALGGDVLERLRSSDSRRVRELAVSSGRAPHRAAEPA